ncbi:MAG: plasmid stabilization system [Chitinophagaceae bacterium]|nr:plasmid stabilization system [Chitinophagaceae bacterium]
MKVEFLKKFSKDLDVVGQKSVKSNLIKVIELMESVNSLDEIHNTKKLRGHKSAYRTRVGNYRLGFFFENATISIARFVHRKDIYKVFP